MKKKIRFCLALAVLICFSSPFARGQDGTTEITRWQFNKAAAISLTYDDGSLNQFRVAVPIMNSLGFPATFFIVTGDIAGSRYHGKFIGRSIEVIIHETDRVPTSKDNLFERASAICYLGLPGAREAHDRAGELYEDGRIPEAYRAIDEAFAQVRRVAAQPNPVPGNAASGRDALMWDELRLLAKKGYEFSSHTITHPHLAVLDEANLVYELEKSRQDILDHLGPKHTFTIECPYGTEDERAVAHALARYPASRNRLPEPYLDEFNRASEANPTASTREYVQWQRGALTGTSMAVMKSWVDTVVAHDNMWLVLVFHGVDGVGWEPKTGAELREYFEYIKSKDDRVWVATFQDVTKYMRERKHSQVRTSRTGEAIEVILRYDLDKELYDLPLTLKTYVSAGWPAADVRQGKSIKSVPAAHDAQGTFVLYQALPNAGPVTLVRAVPKFSEGSCPRSSAKSSSVCFDDVRMTGK